MKECEQQEVLRDEHGWFIGTNIVLLHRGQVVGRRFLSKDSEYFDTKEKASAFFDQGEYCE